MKISGKDLAARLEEYDDAWQYAEKALLRMNDGQLRVLAKVQYRDDATLLFHIGPREKGGGRREVYTIDAFRVGTIELVELTEMQEADIDEMKDLVDRLRAAEREKAELSAELARLQSEVAELDRQNGLAKVASEYQIPYLVHITRLPNLPSILRHGLVPRDQLGDLSDERHVVNDLKRFDGQLDSVSLSISHPNDSLFLRWRLYDYPNETWIVVLLDPRVLWELPCALYLRNSAAATSGLINESRSITGRDLERLFEEFHPLYGVTRADLGYGRADATNEQAEVMVRGGIPIEYVMAVAVEQSRYEEKLAKWLQGKICAEQMPKIVADPSLFNRRPCIERRRKLFRS
jgi:hypothetical protein